MKSVYIIYDRYEHDEWYSVYYLGTNYDKAVKNFKEKALPKFISYGPDDCHSFQLQHVFMSDYRYRQLRALVNAKDKEDELREFMIEIYDEEEYEVETIFFTDGCSDALEIIQLYCDENNLDYNNTDDKATAYKALEDTETWNEYLHMYIQNEY